MFICFSGVQLFVTSWTVAHQALLSMEFSRQEFWSGLPCPSPRDLPDPEMKPVSPALAGIFFTTEPPGKPSVMANVSKYLKVHGVRRRERKKHIPMLVKVQLGPLNGCMNGATLDSATTERSDFSDEQKWSQQAALGSTELKVTRGVPAAVGQ